VSDASLQAVASFMTAAYNQIGKSMLKLVYSKMRAFSCRRSNIPALSAS
jgi:hypothetical protein